MISSGRLCHIYTVYFNPIILSRFCNMIVSNVTSNVTSNTCILCLEDLSENYMSVVYSPNSSFQLHDRTHAFTCLCKPHIHVECMHLWLQSNSGCPICLSVARPVSVVEPPNYTRCLCIFLFFGFFFSFVLWLMEET